ncbi:MAG: hypothetical protein ACLUTZ_09550 [Oliverpabstia sp.]
MINIAGQDNVTELSHNGDCISDLYPPDAFQEAGPSQEEMKEALNRTTCKVNAADD